MKKFIVISVIIAAVFAAVAVTGFFYYKNVFLHVDEKIIIEFIKKYPEKASLRIMRNDSVVADFHANRPMPLASTVKIIVAIEFAQQAANGTIDLSERIPLNTLDLFYIPKTDGGAHPAWLKQLQEDDLIQSNSVTLRHAASGMITFSSNANTEYLMGKLGLENINRTLELLNLRHHEKLYPFISALYLFSNKDALPEDQFYQMMKQLSVDEYIREAKKVHEKLKDDKDSTFRKTFVFPSLNLQRIWSDRLPRSTAEEYAGLLAKINSKSFFSASVQKHLDALLEWPMEANPRNKERFQYLGGKGGSTAFVLTYAMYARDFEGNKTEIVTFFDDLALLEGQRLRTSLSLFQLNALTKQDFRNSLRETIVLLR